MVLRLTGLFLLRLTGYKKRTVLTTLLKNTVSYHAVSGGVRVFAARANICVAAPLVRSAAKSPPLPSEVGPLKSSYKGPGGALFISFLECFRRCGLKPMDGVDVSFVKSLQPAGELCPRTVIDDVRQCLSPSTLTQVGLCHAPMVEAGTAGTMASSTVHPSEPEPVQKGARLTR